MKLSILAGILALTLGQAYAQDFVPASTPAGGLEVVTEAAAEPYQQPVVEEYVSAEDKLREYLNSKGWVEGWDSDKKRLIQIRAESFDTSDPRYDDSFIAKRGVFSTSAIMGAKADIVEFMRTQMSASDQLSAPGTDVHEQLNKRFMLAERKFEDQRAAVAKLLSQVDQAEADMLAGITWSDRGKALLDAAIKKLDDSFDSGQIEVGKQVKFEKAKAKYQAATSELESIEKEAKAIKGQVKLTTESRVELLAHAPLLGATVIAQSESWDEAEEQYEVASLVVWSGKLEASARSLMSNDYAPTKPKKGVTIQEWVAKQDLATMTGSRQMVDKNGQRWFIGAAASYYAGSSSAKRAAKGMADSFAKKEAVMAVYSDVATHKEAVQVSSTRNGGLGAKDNTQVAQSFAETTRQSIENRQVSGLSKITAKSVVHPISGQPLYVAVYAVSPDAARQALAMEQSSFNSAIQADGAQLTQKGVKAGYEQARTLGQNDTSKVAQGMVQAQASLNGAEEKAAKSATKPLPASKGQKSKSTVIVNEADVDDESF